MLTLEDMLKVEKMEQTYKDSPKYRHDPDWLLPVDDYDMDLVRAQWWADKEFGEKGAR